MSIAFRILSTRWGAVGYVASEKGLRRVYLPAESTAQLRAQVRRDHPDAVEDASLLPQAADELSRYFGGQRVKFTVPLDFSEHSDFPINVWRACAGIGYGRTRSYGDLAGAVGQPKAARAVGAAMGRNPWPIVVPCHRVLRGDGGLGGYSGPGGVDFKRRLLEMEAAVDQPL